MNYHEKYIKLGIETESDLSSYYESLNYKDWKQFLYDGIMSDPKIYEIVRHDYSYDLIHSVAAILKNQNYYSSRLIFRALREMLLTNLDTDINISLSVLRISRIIRDGMDFDLLKNIVESGLDNSLKNEALYAILSNFPNQHLYFWEEVEPFDLLSTFTKIRAILPSSFQKAWNLFTSLNILNLENDKEESNAKLIASMLIEKIKEFRSPQEQNKLLRELSYTTKIFLKNHVLDETDYSLIDGSLSMSSMFNEENEINFETSQEIALNFSYSASSDLDLKDKLSQLVREDG